MSSAARFVAPPLLSGESPFAGGVLDVLFRTTRDGAVSCGCGVVRDGGVAGGSVGVARCVGWRPRGGELVGAPAGGLVAAAAGNVAGGSVAPEPRDGPRDVDRARGGGDVVGGGRLRAFGSVAHSPHAASE